jgi:radical SAM protein with 4Fe4S-binding SPASM domain
LVKSGIDRLVLSLDGPEAAIHDGLRGTDGVFDAALEGWHLIREEAHKQKVPPPNGIFHTTVSIANSRMVPEMFALAEHEKVGLTLQIVSQVPREEIQKCRRGRNVIASRQYISNGGDLWLSEKEAIQLKQRIRQLGESRKNISARVLMSLSNQHLTAGTFPIISCSHVHHTISINPRGIVYPCAMLRNYHYGSLEDNSVSEIWKGKKRREFLKSLKKEFFPVCKYCCHYLNNLTPGQMVRVLFGLTLP